MSGLALVMVASPASADAARGWQNLRLVLNGSIAFGGLSPEERGEVSFAARELRRRAATAGLSPRERCRLANLTGATPSPLEEATIDLKCSQR